MYVSCMYISMARTTYICACSCLYIGRYVYVCVSIYVSMNLLFMYHVALTFYHSPFHLCNIWIYLLNECVFGSRGYSLPTYPYFVDQSIAGKKPISRIRLFGPCNGKKIRVNDASMRCFNLYRNCALKC